MKTLSLLAAVLTLGLALGAGNAEAAKRLGSAKSSGMQRQSTAVDKAAPATPAAPAAPATATNAAAAKAPAAAAPAPAATPPKRSWMGPLAGIAAGLGLAALASHFGFGEQIANMLMIGLLVMAALAVVGFIMRRRAAAAQAGTAGHTGNLQYAAAGASPTAAAGRGYDVAMPGGSMIGSALAQTEPATAGAIPAGFDVEGFVSNAKLNFIRLQASNDAGHLEDIRQFTTPEMFATLKQDIDSRNGAPQHTEVVSMDADVLEVVEETDQYVVSVRFTGTIREDRNPVAEPFAEVWHLTKARQGAGGWVLSGIQQLQ